MEAWPLTEPDSVEKWESWIWDGLMRARHTTENLLEVHENVLKELKRGWIIVEITEDLEKKLDEYRERQKKTLEFKTGWEDPDG